MQLTITEPSLAFKLPIAQMSINKHTLFITDQSTRHTLAFSNAKHARLFLRTFYQALASHA